MNGESVCILIMDLKREISMPICFTKFGFSILLLRHIKGRTDDFKEDDKDAMMKQSGLPLLAKSLIEGMSL